MIFHTRGIVSKRGVRFVKKSCDNQDLHLELNGSLGKGQSSRDGILCLMVTI